MPRKQCYWTRKLELDLVEFVKQRECIWKPTGNTNHHIQQKYKAYAEFAATLGRGFTARTVRDRWVNIRSTFNHNLRRVEKSKETATKPSELYVPCWPLWKPLQFLRTGVKKEYDYEGIDHNDLLLQVGYKDLPNVQVKQEFSTDSTPPIEIRQKRKRVENPAQRTDRPRRRIKTLSKNKNSKCKQVIDDLVKAMKPLKELASSEHEEQSYWYFGKHVTERLNSMREVDAISAGNEILRVLEEFENSQNVPTPGKWIELDIE